jgi:signal transduction histidine kinase
LIVNLVGIEKAESFGTNSNDDTTTDDVSYTYIGPIDLETEELELTNSKVEVEKAISSALLFYGDKIKLAQVVRNLVSNALKFTPEFGTVEITG